MTVGSLGVTIPVPCADTSLPLLLLRRWWCGDGGIGADVSHEAWANTPLDHLQQVVVVANYLGDTGTVTMLLYYMANIIENCVYAQSWDDEEYCHKSTLRSLDQPSESKQSLSGQTRTRRGPEKQTDDSLGGKSASLAQLPCGWTLPTSLLERLANIVFWRYDVNDATARVLLRTIECDIEDTAPERVCVAKPPRHLSTLVRSLTVHVVSTYHTANILIDLYTNAEALPFLKAPTKLVIKDQLCTQQMTQLLNAYANVPTAHRLVHLVGNIPPLDPRKVHRIIRNSVCTVEVADGEQKDATLCHLARVFPKLRRPLR